MNKKIRIKLINLYLFFNIYHSKEAPYAGLEPATCRLTADRSTN